MTPRERLALALALIWTFVGVLCVVVTVAGAVYIARREYLCDRPVAPGPVATYTPGGPTWDDSPEPTPSDELWTPQ